MPAAARFWRSCIEVLNAGYVHIDVGTPDEMYVWPYFAEYPIDKLTPPQLVELFKIVYAGDYEDMKNDGDYIFYRVGITPNGEWKYLHRGGLSVYVAEGDRTQSLAGSAPACPAARRDHAALPHHALAAHDGADRPAGHRLAVIGRPAGARGDPAVA